MRDYPLPFRRCLMVVVLSAHLTFVSSCKVTTPAPQELTIFNTNDIHSNLNAPKIDPFELGGVARLSTMLKTLRTTVSDSVTLDAGDWSEGTWYFNINTGANLLQLLSQMNYDAVALGNHDFLVGPDQIIKYRNQANVSLPVLAGNLDMSSYSNSAALLKALPPSTIITTKNGIKVGVIGATTFDPFYSSYMAPVNILNPTTSLAAVAAQLRPNVDVLILLSHNDFDLNTQYAQNIIGLDAVVSGHTHLKTPQAVMVNNFGRNIPVVETGCWGRFLGELTLTVDKSNKTVTFKNFQLLPVTPQTTPDPTIAAWVQSQDTALDTIIDDDVHRVVATSDLDLIQAAATESPLTVLTTKAYRQYAKTDVALEENSLNGISIAKGYPIELMDLHDAMPHIYNPATGKEWTIHIWQAKGSDLALVFQVFYQLQSLIPSAAPTGWLTAENVLIDWDPTIQSDITPSVKSIMVGGVALDPGKTYSVAITDGLLFGITSANQMLSLGLDLSQVADTGYEAWRTIADYAASAKTLTIADLQNVGNYVTPQADLGLYYYGITYDSVHGNLLVSVDNKGLVASSTATVSCATGIPNDSVDFDTSSEVWTTVGTASMAPLASGASTTVSIPWNVAQLVPGYWPVQCSVSSSGDPYAGNNLAEVVLQLPSAPSAKLKK